MTIHRHTSAPIECGHCHNQTIMTVGTSYSQVQGSEPEEPPFERGNIYDVLDCPVCHSITLRKYFWADHMESEADVTYHLLYPNKQDYTGNHEKFFPPKTEHDAYIRIREIIREAKTTIHIVDPYTDGTLFSLLATATVPLEVKVLTSLTGGADFALEAAKFQKQYPTVALQIRLTREFHDRFIILDSSTCYHLGSSIKDAGTKVSMIAMVKDANNVQALLLQQAQSWKTGSILKF